MAFQSSIPAMIEDPLEFINVKKKEEWFLLRKLKILANGDNDMGDRKEFTVLDSFIAEVPKSFLVFALEEVSMCQMQAKNGFGIEISFWQTEINTVAEVKQHVVIVRRVVEAFYFGSRWKLTS